MSASTYVALLHYPIQNRFGETIATAVTNLDIHDIARSCRTYGIRKYFIVTPVEEQHRVVGRILAHWRKESSREWHPDRYSALSRVELVKDFNEVKRAVMENEKSIAKEEYAVDLEKLPEEPEVVFTDARPKLNSLTYAEYRRELSDPARTRPSILVLGTGYGISDAFFPEVHRILTPVYGPKDDPDGEYNHLSVRAAAAVILDRLFGH